MKSLEVLFQEITEKIFLLKIGILPRYMYEKKNFNSTWETTLSIKYVANEPYFCNNCTIYTWGIKGSPCLWSKTALITGGVGRTGMGPPSYKMDTFFLVSLALSLPIYRHFQSNGDNWRGIKHQKNFFI